MRRPGLVDRLIEADEARLAVVVAPPGYGKSSVLCEWAQRDQRPFVWIALEPRAADAAQVTARSIIDAFGAGDWLESEIAAELDEQTDAVGALARLIGSLPRSFVLVLDDAHLVAPRALATVVRACLKELPVGSTIALGSRTQPALPLGRLRAHRELVEVRTHDLAMAPAEAASMLRGIGLEFDFEEIQALVRRTEGWPAALYLAAVSMRERPGNGAEERFTGNDHLLAEYLRDDVFSAVPDDLRDFLLRTSVLDELSGPVCDDLLERRGSAQALARLARSASCWSRSMAPTGRTAGSGCSANPCAAS